MTDTFKGIITADGKKRQLPYGSILETPTSDETLSIQGGFADAKVVGDKFKEVKAETDSLKGDLNTLNQGGLNLKEDFIGTQVNNWLNEHPEATTTVQDGAITEPKIHADFLPYIKKDYVTPEMFGAVGDGVTNDSTAFLNALNASGTLLLSKEYKISDIELPNKDVFIIGIDGTSILCDDNDVIFIRRNRGYYTKIENISINGQGTLFKYDSNDVSLPYGDIIKELEITSCRFYNSSKDVYNIYLYGIRECVIDNCYFVRGNGIYTEFSVNTIVSNCVFRGSGNIVESALGSEGLILSNIIALGCTYGVLCNRTTGVQICNCMIDYCDNSIVLNGAADVLISNNYISSRTANPAIFTTDYNGFNGYNYKISNNNLRTNTDDGTVAVRFENINFLEFVSNDVVNFTTNGIEFKGLTNSLISMNSIRNRDNHTTGKSIINVDTSVDDTSVRISQNFVTLPISKTNNIGIFKNYGFITNNSGEAVITTGNSSVTVNHGLSITPVKNKFQLTPTTPTLGNIAYFVSNVTATQFTITLNGEVSSTTGIAWLYEN